MATKSTQTCWKTSSRFGTYLIIWTFETYLIFSYSSGVGISGELQHMFYVEVTDEMRVDSGGGNKDEDEYIEVVEMSINQVKSLLSQTYVASPAGFLFAVQWFLAKKASNYV